GDGEVDERKLVAGREDPGDAVARGDALLDEGLCERRGLTGAAAHHGELVRRDELRRLEQVGDELGELVHPVVRAADLGCAEPAALQDGVDDGWFLGLVAHPIPRTRYRQFTAAGLAAQV